MKTAVLVFEWRRPRYLRVCLESLRLAECPWPVILSIDEGGVSRDLWPEANQTLFWPSHAGNLWHVVRSLDAVYQMGFDRILFLDGDHIVRTDIFKNLPERTPEGCAVVSCAFNANGSRASWMSNLGNLIERDEAKPLLDYCYSHKWVRRPRPGLPGKLLWAAYPGYDGVFCQYMVDSGKLSAYLPVSYVGHIGVSGLDIHEDHLEAELFAGSGPQDWLQNAARMFREKRSALSFVPHDFVYA